MPSAGLNVHARLKKRRSLKKLYNFPSGRSLRHLLLLKTGLVVM